jgi:hypothetical protein
MDDVIDLRTQLIYASLQDDDLVRQLQEARAAARQRASGSAPAGASSRRHAASGTRPWVTPAAPPAADDIMGADVTSAGASAHVIDVRDQQPSPVTVDLDAPTLSTVVVQQRTSEWSTDDPSYYLG